MAKTKCERLSELIVELLHESFGIEVENVRLYPAKGFWRTNRLADVMPWNGWADVVYTTPDGQHGRYPIALGSWDTMTDLLRFQPISIEKDQHNGYELYAGYVKPEARIAAAAAAAAKPSGE